MCSGAWLSAVAGVAKASAFLHGRVYPDLARDDGVRLFMGGQGAGRQSSPLGWLWGGFNFGRGRRQAGLCSTHMLAGRDVIRYAEAADAEESHQAAATVRGGVSVGRRRTPVLPLFALSGRAAFVLPCCHSSRPAAHANT